jgi:hypothetical protein
MTNPLGRTLGAPRVLAAWALLGYTALFLFFTFFAWLLPGGSFSGRSAEADFRSLLVMAMPVLAVLLAVYVTPQLAGAKVITLVALVEYAFALFFGFVTLLIGLGSVFEGVNSPSDAFRAMAYLVLGAASLGLMAIAGYVCLRAFLSVGGRFNIGTATSPAPTTSTTPTTPTTNS